MADKAIVVAFYEFIEVYDSVTATYETVAFWSFNKSVFILFAGYRYS
jgi:hypothetical protein